MTTLVREDVGLWPDVNIDAAIAAELEERRNKLAQVNDLLTRCLTAFYAYLEAAKIYHLEKTREAHDNCALYKRPLREFALQLASLMVDRDPEIKAIARDGFQKIFNVAIVDIGSPRSYLERRFPDD